MPSAQPRGKVGSFLSRRLLVVVMPVALMPVFSTNTPTASADDPTGGATATTDAASARVFVPEADARVEQASPGESFAMRSLRADGGGDAAVESYLRFAVDGVGGPVRSARLRLFATSPTVIGPAIYGAGNDWTEAALTWENRPARAGTPLDDAGAIASDTWVEYDVTSAITGDGTYSFALAAPSSDGVDLRPRESSMPPQLIIEPAPPPETRTFAIPGIFPETSTNIGPLIDGLGNLYTVTEVSNSLFAPAIRKSEDGGRSWSEVDAGNRPTADDLESVSLVQDGSLVHMVHQRTGYRVFYNSFNTNDAPLHPDAWRTRDEEVFPATSGPEDQSASLVARGDGTLVAFYQVSLTQHAYKVRSSEGVWGPQTIVDTTAGKKFSQIQVVKALHSDRVHIVYKDSSDQTIMYRTLDESNVLGPVQTIGTGVSTRIHALGNHAIVVTDHHGTERVYVAWTRQSDKHLVGTAIEDGVPGDVETISAHPVYENPDSVVSFGAVSSLAAGRDGDVYALYSDGPDDYTGEHDLWYATRSPDGTWDTPAKALDSTDVMAISANVYTHSPANGGKRVLGAVIDVETGIPSEGAVYYTEVALPAVG